MVTYNLPQANKSMHIQTIGENITDNENGKRTIVEGRKLKHQIEEENMYVEEIMEKYKEELFKAEAGGDESYRKRCIDLAEIMRKDKELFEKEDRAGEEKEEASEKLNPKVKRKRGETAIEETNATKAIPKMRKVLGDISASLSSQENKVRGDLDMQQGRVCNQMELNLDASGFSSTV